MHEAQKNELRPYQLSSGKYAVWFEVGEQLGMVAQLAVEAVLCQGRSKLEFCIGRRMEEVDARTRMRIQEIALRRGVRLFDKRTEAK